MSNRYADLIAAVFLAHWETGMTAFEFERSEVQGKAAVMGIVLPKNIGDLIYTFRYRRPLPQTITATAPAGLAWVIEGAGRSKYRFRLSADSTIVPRPDMAVTKIPDATPHIISAYALTDEQALLAKLRYNRLVDIFLGLTAYSLQNHLRTTVKGIGQIEIDELYVGVNRTGCQFIVPVQAKGNKDRIGTVQARQDIAFCAQRYAALACRPLAAQFMSEDVIALLELTQEGESVRVVEEKHYRLVPATEISPEDLAAYRRSCEGASGAAVHMAPVPVRTRQRKQGGAVGTAPRRLPAP